MSDWVPGDPVHPEPPPPVVAWCDECNHWTDHPTKEHR